MSTESKKVWVVGHKNPDTDSICAAISYAYLKNQSGDKKTYVAKRAGAVNEETRYVLERFGVEEPPLVSYAGAQIKDINIRKTAGVSNQISLKRAWELMKKLEAKGLVQRRPYPGSRRKMLYLPTEAGLALNRCHTQYDTRVFGETLALLAERCPQADIECCFRVLEQYLQARRQKHYNSTPE